MEGGVGVFRIFQTLDFCVGRGGGIGGGRDLGCKVQATTELHGTFKM